MSNKNSTMFQKGKDAITRLNELEKEVGKLTELARTQAKMYAEIFNRIGDKLVESDDKFIAVEQLLSTEAFKQLLGLDKDSNPIAEVVNARTEARKLQQEEVIKQRTENEQKFITIGLESGYLTVAPTISMRSVVIGQQQNSEGKIIGMERTQFFVNQLNPEVQGLFLDKPANSTVVLPMGETFKVTELYDVDIEKYTKFMQEQQAKLNEEMAKNTDNSVNSPEPLPGSVLEAVPALSVVSEPKTSTESNNAQ